MSEFEAYRGLFVAESRENHENMVKNLLILEKGSNQDAIDEIFRSIHTLKGASASMGFADMERLCHAMEDIFQLIRSGSAEMSQDLGNLLLACSDMLEQMIDDVEGGGDSSSLNPDDQVQSLKEWLEKLGGGKSKDTKKPVQADHAPAADTDAASSSAPAPDGVPEFDIRIIVSPDCMMKDVRAMIAIGNLEALGTITMITPSKDDIDEGKFDGTVNLRISSEAGEEALRTAAQGSEIATVEITQVQTVKQDKKPAEPEKKQASSAEKSREIKNLRVDIQQLDHIMNLVEDLVINRGRLKQIAEQHRIKEMDEAIGMVDRSVSELQNLMMNIRMIPLNHIFNRLPRVVRDVAQYDGKEVEFVMEGGETELDRSVMDGLNDPLLHLIRNSVNHGIESPEAREAAGKSRKGFVKLAAHRDRDNVIIEIIDDGAGINVEKIKKKAVEKGFVTQEGADLLTDDQAIELLFQPGFSTADKITDISGRGVGLDVVRKSIEALKGTIRVESTFGKGSRFELLLPPTMAIVDVMIVRINGKRLAIPISSIVEVANFRRNTTHRIGKGEAILLRDEVLQIFWLDDMVGSSKVCEILIVVQYQKRKCCVPVDVVEGKQEVVVKPLNRFIGTTRGVSGVTILGDGDVVPVLDVNTMV
ncbi:chemotaxis protein CheA [Methanoregula formicica]|uniref:Chemotaxis protein CheA n=1 Tax=Methanoregula formicica (strain DSM 22288 / NBRC 105244 / SMSP) TaxID=593750 RepID=L0HCU1_METFS|nr:chemotaxis protein CheA [Methanoregula formicica]AGB02552.1 chemotaxis protein histidine kinase-like protein [Methanoregula formicica SMSP]